MAYFLFFTWKTCGGGYDGLSVEIVIFIWCKAEYGHQNRPESFTDVYVIQWQHYLAGSWNVDRFMDGEAAECSVVCTARNCNVMASKCTDTSRAVTFISRPVIFVPPLFLNKVQFSIKMHNIF